MNKSQDERDKTPDELYLYPSNMKAKSVIFSISLTLSRYFICFFKQEIPTCFIFWVNQNMKYFGGKICINLFICWTKNISASLYRGVHLWPSCGQNWIRISEYDAALIFSSVRSGCFLFKRAFAIHEFYPASDWHQYNTQ